MEQAAMDRGKPVTEAVCSNADTGLSKTSRIK